MAESENTSGPLGIRTSLWLIVCGIALLCALVITRSQRYTRGKEKSASESDGSTAQVSSVDTQARPRRRISDQWKGSVPAALTAQEAGTLACNMANARAKELYGCEPFRDPPPARTDEAGWVWTDCRAHGRTDLEAKVRLAPDGSEQNIEVIVLLLDYSL